MHDPYLADVADIQRIPEVETILAELCERTGMGFAAVARVTADRW
ncbi:histidine kinase, partial [Escherichia coli]|nr:histidine kinase [Escherichia coli]